MCDFPNVENNDFELEALISFCEGWDGRIAFLEELFQKGHADEALILCCCYINSVGTWFHGAGAGDEETFAKALLRYSENEVFGRMNPRFLLSMLCRKENLARWGDVPDKLRPAFAGFRDGFYPPEEITAVCRQVLSDEEFTALERFSWAGSLACFAYGITRCEGVQNGAVPVRGCGDTGLDFALFHPALKRIFERARRLIMAGKLRIY